MNVNNNYNNTKNLIPSIQNENLIYDNLFTKIKNYIDNETNTNFFYQTNKINLTYAVPRIDEIYLNFNFKKCLAYIIHKFRDNNYNVIYKNPNFLIFQFTKQKRGGVNENYGKTKLKNPKKTKKPKKPKKPKIITLTDPSLLKIFNSTI